MLQQFEHRIKVIVTDDHTLFRTGVKNALAKYSDIEVIGEAVHGRDLLDKLEYLRPDVITLGLQMPVMDGMQALPILRKNYPEIKIVMLSMHNDPSVICRMIELGANTYLTKEAGSVEIYENIKALRNRWFYINDTVKDAITRQKPINAIPGVPTFTEKEILILRMLKQGRSVTEIAPVADLSPRTVQAIIDKLKQKASVQSIPALLDYAQLHQ